MIERDRDHLFQKGEFDGILEGLLATPDRLLRDVGYDRTREARAQLKNFTARLIGEFIADVCGSGRFVAPAADVSRRIAVLKGMAWQWMIQRTDIETYQYGQRRLVQRLFEGYWDKPEMLPRREQWNGSRQTPRPRGAAKTIRLVRPV